MSITLNYPPGTYTTTQRILVQCTAPDVLVGAGSSIDNIKYNNTQVIVPLVDQNSTLFVVTDTGLHQYAYTINTTNTDKYDMGEGKIQFKRDPVSDIVKGAMDDNVYKLDNDTYIRKSNLKRQDDV